MHKGFHYDGNGDDNNRERHDDGAGDLNEQDRLAHLPSAIKSWKDLRRGFHYDGYGDDNNRERHYDRAGDHKEQDRLAQNVYLFRSALGGRGPE